MGGPKDIDLCSFKTCGGKGSKPVSHLMCHMSEGISNPDEMKKDSYFPNEIEA